MIRPVIFSCGGVPCVGSLHEAPGATGILIVSGGQDPRAGAHRWQWALAEALSAGGVPVFRFDRRGVGDSAGPRTSFRDSQPDLRAAAAAFRQASPHVSTIVGLGNCDGATALALHGREAGLSGQVLLNPWLVPTDDELPPAAAIRARYRSRLFDPTAWGRLLRGQIDLRRAARGLARIARPAGNALADEVGCALAAPGAPPAHLILSAGDATALACRAAWSTPAFDRVRATVPLQTIGTSSHSFAAEGDAERLCRAVRTAVESLV